MEALTGCMLCVSTSAIPSGVFRFSRFGESISGGLGVAQLAWPHPLLVVLGSLLSTIGAGLQSLTGEACTCSEKQTAKAFSTNVEKLRLWARLFCRGPQGKPTDICLWPARVTTRPAIRETVPHWGLMSRVP